jgi:hypothetical protein
MPTVGEAPAIYIDQSRSAAWARGRPPPRLAEALWMIDEPGFWSNELPTERTVFGPTAGSQLVETEM